MKAAVSALTRYFRQRSAGLPAGWRGTLRSAFTAALLLVLLAAWVRLYAPVFEYLSIIFSREEFRTNQIVLAGVTALLLYRLVKSRPRLHLPGAPALHLPALALLLGGSLAYLLVERRLDINTLSASLFVLSSYGLLGLWLPPARWRQGIPALLLVMGVLPFGAHMETFAGYPLRVATAGVVREWLAGLGFQSVGVDTILIFESGVSQVDIPCSGVKSLWTGALFLLAATWIENRPLGLRWLLVAAAAGVLLAASNLLRVALLSLTGPALGFTEIAAMLHLPLGVLGFIAACATAVFLLGRLPEQPAPRSPAGAPALRRPAWLAPLLAAFVLAMIFLYTPRAQASSAPPAPVPQWSFSGGISVQPAPLSTQELDWIQQGGADHAQRYAFEWQPQTGSLVKGTIMLVTSQTWRGQHQPERCFQVYGLTVRQSFTYLASPDLPMRHLSLTAPGVPAQASAVYWLQSAAQATDDYGRRIWADLSPDREPWVLVTVLFDQDYAAQLPALNPFFQALYGSVNRSLTKGSVP